MYPKLLIDLEKIKENARAVTSLCSAHGVRVWGVTKVVGGNARIAQALVDGGVTALGDSRLQDLALLQDIAVPKMLIRSPQLCDADDVVKLADISVNTELPVTAALDAACERQGVEQHGIMLMCDLGDLREGFVSVDELMAAVEAVEASKHLYVHGIGANLNCLSFILPDEQKMEELIGLAAAVERRTGRTLEVSGGNSSNLRLLMDGQMPTGINALRLGESLLFGRERAAYTYVPGTFNDAFIFQAAIIELKDKPSMPWGTAGADSYGNYHTFADRGIRRRAIVAFGHQDAEAEVMWPTDEGIEIVDSASDHTVLDITDAKGAYQIGDVVEFRCGYHAVGRAFMSPYVENVFLH